MTILLFYMPADRLGILLSRTFSDFRALFRTLFVAAVVFGLILTIINIFIGEDRNLATASMDELIVHMVLAIVSVIVSYAAYVFYMVLIVERHQSINSAFARVPTLFAPLVGVSFWIVVRSFLWVAIIGVLITALSAISPLVGPAGVLLMIIGFAIALVKGPRYALSPFIYIKEKRGIKESVDLSYNRSEGYWGKIVGNMAVISILTTLLIIAIIVCLIVIALILSLFEGKMFLAESVVIVVITLTITLVSQFAQGFTMIFMSHLTDTISRNSAASPVVSVPTKATAKKAPAAKKKPSTW